MALRSLKIASLRFSHVDEKLFSKTEQARLEQLIDDLRTLCPRAATLNSSTLDTAKIDDGNGTILEYWLREIPQRTLPFTVQRAGRNHNAGIDGFADDVTQLTNEIHAARGFFIVAVEPVYTAEQLRAPDLFTTRVRQIRRRVTQRQILQIPTVDGTGMPMPRSSHSHLPLALKANVRAIVHGSVRHGTKLKDVKFIGNHPSNLAGLSIPNQVLLRRPDFDESPMLMRTLDRAMDSNEEVRLRVLVNLDWVDGSVESFSFAGIYKRTYNRRGGPKKEG